MKAQTTDVNPKILLEYPTHPFLPDVCTMIAKLPKGFENAALTSLLSLRTIRILAGFQQSVPVSPPGVNTPSTPQTPELLNSELMQASSSESLPPLESCICFALSRYRQSYASQGYGAPGPQCFLQNIARGQTINRARSRFSSEFQACWAKHRDNRAILPCLVWIIAVIGATGSEQPTDHEDFSGLWREAFDYSGCLYSEEALHDTLCDFFHKETFLKEAEALRKACSRL